MLAFLSENHQEIITLLCVLSGSPHLAAVFGSPKGKIVGGIIKGICGNYGKAHNH